MMKDLFRKFFIIFFFIIIRGAHTLQEEGDTIVLEKKPEIIRDYINIPIKEKELIDILVNHTDTNFIVDSKYAINRICYKNKIAKNREDICCDVFLKLSMFVYILIGFVSTIVIQFEKEPPVVGETDYGSNFTGFDLFWFCCLLCLVCIADCLDFSNVKFFIIDSISTILFSLNYTLSIFILKDKAFANFYGAHGEEKFWGSIFLFLIPQALFLYRIFKTVMLIKEWKKIKIIYEILLNYNCDVIQINIDYVIVMLLLSSTTVLCFSLFFICFLKGKKQENSLSII